MTPAMPPVMPPDRLRGLPPLPPGERLLWQGAPDRRTLARSAFHARKLAAYFAVLLGVRGGVGPAGHAPTPPLVLLGALALGVIAFAELLAWLAARTTVYAITSRRVLMHFGLALPTTVNIPLPEIAGAALCARGNGRGDIALSLCDPARLKYAVLWPHARAWHLRRAQPQLRGVEDAAAVGELLRRALADAVPDESLATGAVLTPRAAGATTPAPVPLAAAS